MICCWGGQSPPLCPAPSSCGWSGCCWSSSWLTWAGERLQSDSSGGGGEVGELSTWYLIQSVTLPDLTMSWLFCLWVAACLSLPSPLPHSLSQSPTSRPATSYHVLSCESNSRNSRPWSLNLSVSQSVKLFKIIHEIISMSWWRH